MGSNAFYNQPLESAKAFRLLKLHRGNEEEELSASLELANLEDRTQEYEALSYHWGSPVFQHKIKIGDEYLNITETLHDALLRIRLQEQDRITWVDAICINQNAIDEKNFQVKLMGRIFAQCRRAIIYLGPEADGSALVPDFIHELISWFRRDVRSADPAWKRGAILGEARSTSEGLPPRDDIRWHAFKNLLRRPWFRRVWIMQEFVLPKDLVTICGHWELEGTLLPTVVLTFTTVIPLGFILQDDAHDGSQWDVIKTTVVLLKKHLSLRLAWGHGSVHFSDAMLQRISIPQRHLNMIELVDWAARCQTTDPRDRFFGVFGLANDLSDHSSLLPAYDKSMREVTDAYLTFFIHQGHGARLLESALPFKQSPQFQPSWFPDWVSAEADERVRLKSADLSSDMTKPDTYRWKNAVTQISVDRLSVRGFRLDSIHLKTSHKNNIQSEFFEEVLNFWKTSNSSLSQQYFRRMATRVLIRDQAHQKRAGNHASEDLLDSCERLIAGGL